MQHGERDQFGRLNVPDEELVANARGAMFAACLSIDTIIDILGCDRSEAEHFQECAHADLARIRMLAAAGGIAERAA